MNNIHPWICGMFSANILPTNSNYIFQEAEDLTDHKQPHAGPALQAHHLPLCMISLTNHQPHGRLPPLRRGQAGLHDQGDPIGFLVF